MRQSGNNDVIPRDTLVEVERIRAGFEQIPVAALVTVLNAAVMLAVLAVAAPNGKPLLWFAVSVLVAALRVALWWAYHRAAPTGSQHGRWAMASVFGAFAAGALWGGGSVVLFPESEMYQLFWLFLIGGMCAGAAALHYAHLPSTLAFILPAGVPLAIRFAVDGSERRAAAAAMIAVFLTALVVTARRSSRYFGETIRLRLDLAHRTRELDAAQAKLRLEMSEHRNTETILRHAQKMEAVGQLTGGIAHDFNNLLTVVLGSLALLRKQLPDGNARAASLLDNAVQGAERGAALTQRLLAFGRRQPLRPESVHLSALIPGMSALLRSSLGVGVRVGMQFPATLAPVLADANQLELALLNLVVNARDAMPAGGDVTISAREEPMRRAIIEGLGPSAYVVLSVADSGEGMDQATLTRAMEPFFTTKGIGKGSGLGLAMVHGFAAQSGGRLVLDSRPGVGTVAELWLPRAEPRSGPLSSAAPDRSRPATPMPARPCTILVVDDDPLVLASTASMLEDLGHIAVTAGSGPEALERLDENLAVELMITDYAMPGMTGLQLAAVLEQRQPLLPIVVATGYAELPAADMIGRLRLAKPFGQDALAKAIADSLNAVAPR